MNKGILVVSFGTSFEETRKKCIDSIENKIRESYTEYTIKRSFTSKMIIKKLKERDNLHIDTPFEALEKMIDSGMTEIHVQPLHIIPGFEYEKVKNAVAMARHRSDIKITFGSPLLNKDHHYDEVVETLVERLPKQEDGGGILLMGHGTEHFANACYSMLQNKLNDLRDDILLTNVEGYPEIDHVMDAIESKYKKMTLMPLMLVAGDHARNDMAGEKDSYKELLEEKGIEVTCILEGLGQNQKIQEAFINRIEEAFIG